MKKVISINEKFTLSWVCSIREADADYTDLKRLGFKPRFEPLTKDNCGTYPVAEGRKEAIFTVENIELKDAAFIKEVLKRIS